jgi:hypothetical protein
MRNRAYSGVSRTVVYGSYEWDADKAATNLKKHGVAFEEAADGLDTDAHELAEQDPADANRVRSLVLSAHVRVLLVVTTERGNRTRIVSARKATSYEQRTYQDARARR